VLNCPEKEREQDNLREHDTGLPSYCNPFTCAWLLCEQERCFDQLCIKRKLQAKYLNSQNLEEKPLCFLFIIFVIIGIAFGVKVQKR
jgi:hypothetical protein